MTRSWAKVTTGPTRGANPDARPRSGVRGRAHGLHGRRRHRILEILVLLMALDELLDVRTHRHHPQPCVARRVEGRGHEHGGEATTAELLTDLGVEEDPLQTRLDVLREAGQAAIRGDLETGQILVLTHGVRHVDTLAHRDITNVSVRQIICARAWRSA